MKRLWPSVLAASIAASLALAPGGTGCKKGINQKNEGESCSTHSQCKSGLVCDCSTRTCLPQGQGDVRCELPDASWPDAAIIDAAVIDAALEDAATGDASVMDDADTTDASVMDAATVDASP
jgi:hypothetical protein